MWKFGEKTGLAFQIKDDLLDLGDGKRTGKPTGQDIREKKLTLPLIHTLQVADGSVRRRLLKLVKRAPKDPEAVREVMDAILNGPGLKYAREKMMVLRNEAVEILNNFEEGDAKKALIDMLDFTIQRSK
jgi:octaprenyl-diphosphate synthase